MWSICRHRSGARGSAGRRRRCGGWSSAPQLAKNQPICRKRIGREGRARGRVARGQAWRWDSPGGRTRAGRAGPKVRAGGEADRARRQKAARTGKWPLVRLDAPEPALQDLQSPRRRYADGGGVARKVSGARRRCSPPVKRGGFREVISELSPGRPVRGHLAWERKYVSARPGPEGWARVQGGKGAGSSYLSSAIAPAPHSQTPKGALRATGGVMSMGREEASGRCRRYQRRRERTVMSPMKTARRARSWPIKGLAGHSSKRDKGKITPTLTYFLNLNLCDGPVSAVCG